MTEFASPGPVTPDGLQPTVAAVAKAVADRADELVDVLGEAVIRKLALSNVAVVLRRDDVSDAVCRANIRSILAAMVDETQFDSAPATTIGVERAGNKMAFSSLLASDRIGFRQLWDIVANEAARHSSINAEALRSLTEQGGVIDFPRDRQGFAGLLQAVGGARIRAERGIVGKRPRAPSAPPRPGVHFGR